MNPISASTATVTMSTVAMAASASAARPVGPRRAEQGETPGEHAAAYSGRRQAEAALVNIADERARRGRRRPGTGSSAREAARNRLPEPMYSGTSQAATTTTPAPPAATKAGSGPRRAGSLARSHSP